jgi:hypothetical protein
VLGYVADISVVFGAALVGNRDLPAEIGYRTTHRGAHRRRGSIRGKRLKGGAKIHGGGIVQQSPITDILVV